MNTNGHEYRWTSCAATTSWDEAHPGARASRPHKSWHSLRQLLHPGRSATGPGLCFGRTHAVPAGRVAGCRIAGNRAVRNGIACGRDARVPGGPLLPSLLLLEAARAGGRLLKCGGSKPPVNAIELEGGRTAEPAAAPVLNLNVRRLASQAMTGLHGRALPCISP